MGIVERKIRQKEEVRTAILNAAWQTVTEEGWQALSIRKIAEAIEYSVPVIYDHFANKEAILYELTKQGFQLLNQQLIKARKRSTIPEKQLEDMAHAYWEFAFENKAQYQVMYGLGIPSCETVLQSPEIASFTGLVTEPIKELITKNKKTNADPLLKLQTFWSMLHGLVSINMMNHNEHKEEHNQREIQYIIAAFISGIKT